MLSVSCGQENNAKDIIQKVTVCKKEGTGDIFYARPYNPHLTSNHANYK
jgi:hypothetical protein